MTAINTLRRIIAQCTPTDMAMDKRQLTTAAIVILLFIITICAMNAHIIEQALREPVLIKPASRIKTQTATTPVPVSKKDITRPTPDNPADYGITVRSKERQPRSQLEWDRHIETQLKATGLLENKQASETFDAIKVGPDNYAKHMAELERRIALLEEEKRSNPSDAKVEKRLQGLYRLNAIGKALKEKVSAPPDTPLEPPVDPSE